MKTALVFGGTRFFGVNLVNALLKKGIKVTIATRQTKLDPFGNAVERLHIDRFNESSVKEAVKGGEWDVVFDQICYSSDDAAITVNALEGRVKRYIFTSTLSVYDDGIALTEDQFNPYAYKLKMVDKDEVSYQEGKRQAESFFFQVATFPVVAVRLPIVMGEEDYTKRLEHYIENIKKGNTIFLPNPEAKMCFIHQEEAGDFLAWVAGTDYTGPINACANGDITLKDLMDFIGHQVGKEVKIDTKRQIESPYGINETWTLSNNEAVKLGYKFSNLMDWLPNLIKKLALAYGSIQ
jgi:nucleoside-diphosphate-sugar epimerase